MSCSTVFPSTRSQIRSGKPTPKRQVSSGELLLQQREENLISERKKLDLAWRKLNEDIQELEDEQRKIEELKEELKIWEEGKANVISEKSVEESFLSKVRYDLMQQLMFAEKELSKAKRESENSQDLTKTQIQDLNDERRSKEEIVQQIKDLIDEINNDLESREHDVIQIEYDAQQHKMHLKQVQEISKDLTRKKVDAISEKGRLLAILEETKRRNQLLQDARETAESKLLEAKEQAKKLEEEDKKLCLEEKEILEKERRLNDLRESLDKARLKQTELEIKQKSDEDALLEQTKCIPQDFDNDEIENKRLQIEIMTNELAQREELLGVQKSKEMGSFEKRKRELEEAIAFLDQGEEYDPNADKNVENNRKRLLALEEQIKQKEEEIRELSKQLKPEDQLSDRNVLLSEENEKLNSLEKDVSLRSSLLLKTEDSVDKDEELAKFNQEEAMNEKEVAMSNLAQTQKKLEMYQTALVNSKDRLSSLQDTLNRMKESVIQDTL